MLATGDGHLLAVAGDFPIHTPAEFLAMSEGEIEAMLAFVAADIFLLCKR